MVAGTAGPPLWPDMPQGSHSDPIILLQDCGFPDGLQPPQALRHRGRAPVLALSPIPTWGLNQQSQAGKLRHAAGSGVLHLLHCEPTHSGCGCGAEASAPGLVLINHFIHHLLEVVFGCPQGPQEVHDGITRGPHTKCGPSDPTSWGQEAPGTGDRQGEEQPRSVGEPRSGLTPE